MRQESANPPPPNMIEWIKIWGSALFRPTPAGYAAAFGAVQPHRATAMAWLVTGGIVAAIVNLISYTAPPEFVLVVMACVLPLNAFIYAALTIFTARGALWIASQMERDVDRSTHFDRLFYALAAINAPMSMLSALAYLLPFPLSNLLAYTLSIYWMYLTVLAVKTLLGLSWGRAAAASAVFIAASLLVVVLGVGVAMMPPV